MSDEEKSHEATPHKREEARKQGRFARARDAGTIATIGAALGALVASKAAIGRAVQLLFTGTHGNLLAISSGETGSVLRTAGFALAAIAGPPAIAAAIAGTVAGFAQAGFHLNLDLVSFKTDRLNPLPKLGQLFQMRHGGLEVAMALLRVGAVGAVGWRAIKGELPVILRLGAEPFEAIGGDLAGIVTRVIGYVLLSILVLGVIDYAQSRFNLERDLMMSHKEIMDETKQQDGDPKLRGKMRAKARALAKKRSLVKVKDAAVVVTNPTHVSVALRYRDNDPAPIVVAKGHDELAMRIRAEARKHGVPILENRRLARALDAEVPLGHPVPGAHFVAVARVLAFVYHLKKKRAGA